MPTIPYIEKDFGQTALYIIEEAVKILNEYQRQGFTMTLRQLYYQFVARDLFPENRRWSRVPNTKRWIKDPNGTKNADPNYKWMGGIVNDARLAGYIDWKRMEDVTRKLEEENHWSNPREFMDTVYQYHLNRWKEQQYRPEIWIEKDALIGVIEPICKRLDVPYFSCRGYNSQSAMWEAAQRLIEHIHDDHAPYIFHMGDHDPSGIDMSHDIQNRLSLFLEYEGFEMEADWHFKRIALSMDQINALNPPSDPAKLSDSRGKEYIKKYGDRSWELDALSPATLAELIQNHVEEITDDNVLFEVEEREAKHKEIMQAAVDGMDFNDEEKE